MEAIRDASHLYEGELRIFLQQPKEEVRLTPGQTFTAAPRRPHLVTNAGNESVRLRAHWFRKALSRCSARARPSS